MKVWVALYKGEGNWVNKVVRKWTKSIYSHAELVLDDKQTWIGISPFIKARLVQRKVNNYDPEKWDFYEISVNQEQHNNHAHEDLYIAIRDAFDIAERQLKSIDKKHRIERTHKIHDFFDHEAA